MALLATSNASYLPEAVRGGLQQILGHQQITPTHDTTLTRTRTMTRTRYQIELVTKAMTEAHARPTMAAEPVDKMAKAVHTWYAGQKKHGCDKTACASCRWWYKCASGERECFQCDTAPYCEACEAPAKEAAEPSKGQHDHSSLPSLRKTCSLGPGRTVPCDFKGKGPIIAFGGDKESFAANVKMTSHRKTCIINQDTEVPCYSKGDVIVFGN